MAQDGPEMLELLKFELKFVEDGGYVTGFADHFSSLREIRDELATPAFRARFLQS
jgi:hypothetical protein